jgi:hypothetical protein
MSVPPSRTTTSIRSPSRTSITGAHMSPYGAGMHPLAYPRSVPVVGARASYELPYTPRSFPYHGPPVTGTLVSPYAPRMHTGQPYASSGVPTYPRSYTSSSYTPLPDSGVRSYRYGSDMHERSVVMPAPAFGKPGPY